ncbi:MAG: efflux RND transporter periplasmic adaptor subunit [Acidobacteria bacterium]|nr:MAG: efflux RND transporter periplasmic adaptor subunit [Acidobacteriota bacterium]
MSRVISISKARFRHPWQEFVRKFLLCATSALMFLAAGCNKDPKAAGPQGPPAMPVKVQVAQSVPVSDTTDYVATLKSRASAIIMPQVEGQIVQIYVHSGDRVAEGTPLVQIDPSKQQATVKSQQDTRAAQEANLKFLQEQYRRTSSLFAAGVVSKQELDQARTALEAAQAQLQSLDAQVHEQQVQLHYYKVDAPWSGIVGDIPVHVGDRVTTSTMLTTVDKPGSLEVYVYVPVERSAQLHMNIPVQVVDGAGNVIAESLISFISPEVDNTTQTVLVKARIGSGKEMLRQLQFIRARVVWGTQKNPVVPVLAVSRIGGQFFVFVAEPDKNGSYVARQKPLKVGQMAGNDYVVLDGIKPGDKVIVSGTQFLVDGAPVIPQESSS